MARALALAGVVLTAMASSSSLGDRVEEAAGYEYTCVGDCAGGGPPRQPRGGALLMGGSTDVPEAFEWLARQADGGDILVLRATGTAA